MLLRFGAENVRSIHSYCEVSFISTSQRDEPTWRMASPHAPHGVLPVLGVYGANASGKSNLLQAVETLAEHVRHSWAVPKPTDPIPWEPFAGSTGPSRLDLDWSIDHVRYHYGFRWTADRFAEEWLFAWPRGRRQVLFHRDHTREEAWYFGSELTGPREAIRKATRPNALFLSAAAQYQHPQLEPVWRAIAALEGDKPVVLDGVPLFHEAAPLLAPANRHAVLRLLQAADLGVSDFRKVKHDPRLSQEERHLLDATHGREGADSLLRDVAERYEVRLRHGPTEASGWELAPHQESRGTLIFLARVAQILETLRQGSLWVVDELETSLHPDLCGAIVDLFTSRSTNPRGAQLLFSTHQRALLKHLRRDEVLLLDKDATGGTRVRTASDFKGVRGRDALPEVYRQGRVGGVPVLGDLREVLEAWHAQEA